MNWIVIQGSAYDHLDVKADALVTDPPYGRNHKPGRTGTAVRVSKGLALINRQWKQIEGEDKTFDPTPLFKFVSFRFMCLWGANHYAAQLPNSPGWLIWDKRVTMPSNDQSDCEMAWTNQNRAARIYRQMWNGVIRGGEENIAVSGSKQHPHQKPVALMMRCLDRLGVKPGMTVFDPFMGSGTTGVACMRMGINFIGCEIDAEYCEIAMTRLEDAWSQSSFFEVTE